METNGGFPYVVALQKIAQWFIENPQQKDFFCVCSLIFGNLHVVIRTFKSCCWSVGLGLTKQDSIKVVDELHEY